MKTSDFETKFTAWMDGQLDAQEATAFEAELREKGFDPELEREAHGVTRGLLRSHSPAPSLGNGDFFNHQLMHAIERDSAPVRSASRGWWSFPRLIWASAVSLVVAGVLFKTLIPVGNPTAADPSPYFATVVDARALDSSISVSTIYNPRDNVTVLSLEGMEFMPGDIVPQ